MTNPTTAVASPSSSAFFSEWMNHYQLAADQYARASQKWPAAKDMVSMAKVRVEQIQSDVVANGGTEAVPIDGKNEAQRAAQLTTALRDHKPWNESSAWLRAEEVALQTIEGEMKEQEYAMRGARLALEYATSWMALKAAVAGGKVGGRENG